MFILQVSAKEADGWLQVVEKYGIIPLLAILAILGAGWAAVRYIRSLEKNNKLHAEQQKAILKDKLESTQLQKDISGNIKEISGHIETSSTILQGLVTELKLLRGEVTSEFKLVNKELESLKN